MNIKIILDGKLKEPYFKAGVDEFKKRVSGFVDLKIVECVSRQPQGRREAAAGRIDGRRWERSPQGGRSDRSTKGAQAEKSSKFLEHVKQNSFLITLEIDGQMLSSVEFAKKIREIESDGYYNEIIFAIGASDGLPDEVKAASNFKFSLSRLTFLHQEAVLILTEQIYRAFKILNGEKYHK